MKAISLGVVCITCILSVSIVFGADDESGAPASTESVKKYAGWIRIFASPEQPKQNRKIERWHTWRCGTSGVIGVVVKGDIVADVIVDRFLGQLDVKKGVGIQEALSRSIQKLNTPKSVALGICDWKKISDLAIMIVDVTQKKIVFGTGRNNGYERVPHPVLLESSSLEEAEVELDQDAFSEHPIRIRWDPEGLSTS